MSTDVQNARLVKVANTFAKLLPEGAIKEDIDTLIMGFTEAEVVKLLAYPFQTAKGLRFNYIVKGNELIFSRKEKSVTRASVFIALEMAFKLQNAGIQINGSKKLRCFGARYLYPVFKRLDIIAGMEKNADKPI